jgi:hypothetical protein
MWSELMETFQLEGEVADFVKARVKEMVAEERHDFAFSGGNHTYFCDLKTPHPPHVLGTYDTVRHGVLARFCLGREGEVPGQGGLHIVVTERAPGAPEYPGIARGYWFMKGGPEAA